MPRAVADTGAASGAFVPRASAGSAPRGRPTMEALQPEITGNVKDFIPAKEWCLLTTAELTGFESHACEGWQGAEGGKGLFTTPSRPSNEFYCRVCSGSCTPTVSSAT